MSGKRTVIKYLDREQVARFFSVIVDRRDRALLGTIYHFGLRVSEATLLRLEDLDLARGRIFIHRLKGGHSREHPLFKSTARALRKYLEVRQPTGPALFTGRQGNLERRRIEQLFKRYAQAAGLSPSFTVRCLRHSIATHLLEAGCGIEFVQDHLGHVNIQNTLIYAKLTDRRREEVYRQLEGNPEIVQI